MFYWEAVMKGCRTALLSLLLAKALSGTLAVAGEVYRCEKEGLVYQDQPCDGPGGMVELPVHQPSAAAIQRAEASRQRLRAVLERVTEAQAAQSDRSHPTPPQAADTPAADSSTRRVLRRDQSNRSAADACPLGLSRCLKADKPVYRRPKSFSGSPLAPTPNPDMSSTQTPPQSP